MTLQKLKPHLKALSQEDKLEAMKFLREVSTTEEELRVMEESDVFMKDYFEKHPEELEKGCVTVEGNTNIMEIFKELASAKV